MEFRRLKILLLAVSLLCLLPSFSKIYGATLSKPANNLGLVGYWSFNEGTSTQATDFSGRGNTGTLTNVSAPATASSGWGTGKLGGGLKFDGSDDYVEVPNSSVFGITGDITISAWVKRSALDDYGGILSKGNGSDSWDYEFYICGDAQCGGAAGIGLFTNVGGNITSTGQITDLLWHHVVVTRSGSTVTFYIDGVSSGGGTYSGIFTNNSHPIRIGTDGPAWSPVSIFNGSIDEVRLYNRGLTATEVRNLYSSGSAKVNASQSNLITNGLIGYWSLNSSDVSDKVYDKSGNGNNGYVNGRATSTLKTIGKLGQSLDFDGTSDYVYLGTPASLFPTSAITMSAWIRPDQLASSVHILTNDDALTVSNILRTQGSGIRCSISGTSLTHLSGLVVGEWAHVACVYDGSNIIAYINGISVASTPLTGSITYANSNTEPWRIGKRGDAAPAYFNGKIDEVRMYSRALSASEIRTLYNSGESKINASQNNIFGSSLNSGLVGMWSFNSRDLTDRVYDRSGQNNHGYFVNMATATAKTIGKVGQALKFDGVDDYVSTADIDFATGGWTLSAWVKTSNTVAPLIRVFSKGLNDGSAQLWFLVRDTGILESGWYVNSPLEGFEATSAVSVNDGNWHHIVSVVTATHIQIYVDGVASGSPAAHDGTPVTNNYNWLIGSLGGADEFFNGSIDEARIYNRDLSATEIKQLYLMGR